MTRSSRFTRSRRTLVASSANSDAHSMSLASDRNCIRLAVRCVSDKSSSACAGASAIKKPRSTRWLRWHSGHACFVHNRSFVSSNPTCLTLSIIADCASAEIWCTLLGAAFGALEVLPLLSQDEQTILHVVHLNAPDRRRSWLKWKNVLLDQVGHHHRSSQVDQSTLLTELYFEKHLLQLSKRMQEVAVSISPAPQSSYLHPRHPRTLDEFIIMGVDYVRTSSFLTLLCLQVMRTLVYTFANMYLTIRGYQSSYF